MTKNYFDKGYVDYWKNRVKNKTRDLKVPQEQVQNFFIKKLNILKRDRILDLGCGHGALFSLLNRFSQNIVGIDINPEAVKEATKFSYQKIKNGSAEKTTLPKDFFDKIVAWAVYDVVNQEKALIEENRILKNNGLLLITGKNDNYLINDKEAFIAERNAKLKNFPNHFSDVYKLLKNIDVFGFKIKAAYGFSKRGDFAKNKYINILKNKNKKFYEFLVILEKTSRPRWKSLKICGPFSSTALRMAQKAGFKDVKKFFRWHKQKYND